MSFSFPEKSPPPLSHPHERAKCSWEGLLCLFPDAHPFHPFPPLDSIKGSLFATPSRPVVLYGQQQHSIGGVASIRAHGQGPRFVLIPPCYLSSVLIPLCYVSSNKGKRDLLSREYGSRNGSNFSSALHLRVSSTVANRSTPQLDFWSAWNLPSSVLVRPVSRKEKHT